MKRHFPFLLLLLGFLSACTSNTVKMDPAERDEVLAKNANILQSARERLIPGERAKLKIVDCPKTESQCRLVECVGVHEDMNCWKTPMTEKDLAAFEKETDRGYTKKMNIDQLKATCESTDGNPKVRRHSCFSFLRNPGNSVPDILDALKSLCDLEGVSCSKNKTNFGKGNIQSVRGRNVQGGSAIIQLTSSKPADHYEYTIVD
jgi:hypothetical protein